MYRRNSAAPTTPDAVWRNVGWYPLPASSASANTGAVEPFLSLDSGSRKDATIVGDFVAPVLMAMERNAEARSAPLSIPAERATSNATRRARASRPFVDFADGFARTVTPEVAASAS